jgi:hypothetical protein
MMQETPMNTTTERRQFWRSGFHSPANVSLLGRDHRVRVLDVSLKGALIEHAGDWVARAGQPCHLRIELAPDAVIVMESQVAHIDGKHIGLRCDKIDLDSITHLRQLVERNAEDPRVLDRDLVKLVARP